MKKINLVTPIREILPIRVIRDKKQKAVSFS